MTQVHNSQTGRKLDLRRKLLGHISEPRVLELYAGPGFMRADVYAGLPVVGIDQDPHSVAEYLGDTAFICRCIDLSRFNVFDADAFAMPWEALWVIAQRREPLAGERVVVFGTDGGMGGGANMKTTFAGKGWSGQMCRAIGVQPDDSPKGIATGKDAQARCAHRLLAAFFERWTVTRYLSSTGGGTGQTLYFGVLLTAGSPGAGPEVARATR